MAEQLTVQACFLGYVFSFALTGLIWLVRKDQLDSAALPVTAEQATGAFPPAAG